MSSLAFVVWVLVFLAGTPFAKRTGQIKLDANVRSYNFTITNLRHTYLHPDYFGPTTKMELLGPNEYNLKWDILKTLPAASKAVVYSFERNNRGEYVPSITVRETLCEEFRKQAQHQPIYTCARYHEAGFRECPFKKGVYTASKVRCTAADGAAVAPGRFWRLNKTWIAEGNVLLSATLIDFTINRGPGSPFK